MRSSNRSPTISPRSARLAQQQNNNLPAQLTAQDTRSVAGMAALPENERQAADSPRCRLGCRACRSGPDARIQDALSGAAGFRNLASHLIETAGQEIAFGLVGGEFEGLTIGLGRFRGPAELAQQVRLGGGQVPVTGEVATALQIPDLGQPGLATF